MTAWLDSFGLYLESGGWVMLPLLGSAGVIWFCLGYRMLTLRRGNRRSVRVLIDRYESGYARRPRGLIDGAVERAVRVAAETRIDLRRALDGALARHEIELSRFAIPARAFVAGAPLFGLLGTVIGMIETFDSLGDMSLFSQSGGIAGGIAQALFTTQLGLAVAIPGLLIGRMLEQRQRAFENELVKIKDILCAKHDGRTA